ncbi:O-antigen ligase family protein [Rhodococcus fascians]|nr:O-antigen ligase family protein [Rhodococcus fascians]
MTTTAPRNASVKDASDRRGVLGATWAWSAVALAVPIYRTLPGSAALAWFGLTAALIIGGILTGRCARPARFAGIWIVAGYASLVAIVTATDLGSPSANLRVGVQLFVILGLGVFVLTGSVRRDPRFVATVVTAFLVTQTASAAAGIAQLSGFVILGQATINERSPGLSGHPNVLGVMASIAIIVCLAASQQTDKRRLLIAGCAAVNVGGLLATGSLSSMSACALGLLVAAFALRVRTATIVRVALAVTLTGWLVYTYTDLADKLSTPSSRFLQVTGQTDAASTLEIRSETYQFAWDAIQKSPWAGVGLSSNNAASFDNVTVVHNLFLRSWYQGGILLALAVALIVGAVILVALRSIGRGQDGAAAGVLVAVITFALTSAFFEQPYYWLPLLLAFAMLTPTPKQQPLRRAVRS